MKKQILSTAAIAAIAANTLFAGPIVRGDVPGDALWVFHLDCDGLKKTTVGKFILDETQKPEVDAKLNALQVITGIDPRKQLHSVTVFGEGSSTKDGVAIIYADIDAERLTTLVKAMDDHQSTEYNGTTIHNWTDEKKKTVDGTKPRIYAAIAGKRVVFGQSEASITKALDVMLHGASSLKEAGTFPMLGGGGSGFIQAAMTKLDMPGSAPHAMLFKLASQATLNVKETGGQAGIDLILQARDEDTAGNMMSIAQGLLALGRLQQDKPDVTKIINAVTVKQDGIKVIGSFSMPASNVIELMKSGEAQKSAKKAEKEPEN